MIQQFYYLIFMERKWEQWINRVISNHSLFINVTHIDQEMLSVHEILTRYRKNGACIMEYYVNIKSWNPVTCNIMETGDCSVNMVDTKKQ